MSRPLDRWLVAVAGFSQAVSEKIIAEIKLINKDKYLTYYQPISPDLNSGGKYSAGYVDRFVRNVYKLSFVQASSPNRFCDFHERACTLRTAGPHDCKKTEREACGRLRPVFILVLYADGGGTSVLVERVNRFAFHLEILRRTLASGQIRPVLESLLRQVEQKFEYLTPHIGQHPRKVKSPLVLPVRNFIPRELPMSEFLREVRLAANTALVHDAYHEKWKIKDRASVVGHRDRRDLDFKPADTAPHGRAAIPEMMVNDPSFVLSSFYRLGIPFSDRLHFDVDRANGRSIDLALECVRVGGRTPRITAEHVNVYPNDVIGNQS